MKRLFYYNGKYYELVTQPYDLGCKNCVFDGDDFSEDCEKFSGMYNCGELADLLIPHNLTFYLKPNFIKLVSIF